MNQNTSKTRNVEDFLKSECSVEWDVVNEFSDEYKNLKDPFKKYFIYKLSSPDSAYKEWDKKFKEDNPYWRELKDPDTQSTLLQEIYGLLWPDLVDKCFMKEKNYIYADTMNSVQTTLVQIMKDIDKEKEILGNLVKRKRNYSANYSIALYSKTEEAGEFVKELRCFNGLENLIRYYHTIGNFLPVPYGFNSLRYRRTQDYWDLTLFRIYKWYLATGDKTAQNDELHNLLCKEYQYKPAVFEEAVRSCEMWLAYFVTWQGFIEKNFLQDFVLISNRVYGKPKEFWAGHFSGPLLPETKTQMECFCTNASSWILARGNRMAIALNEILHGLTSRQSP